MCLSQDQSVENKKNISKLFHFGHSKCYSGKVPMIWASKKYKGDIVLAEAEEDETLIQNIENIQCRHLETLICI